MDGALFVFECFPLDPFVSEYEVLGIIDLFTCDRYVYFEPCCPPGGYKVLSVVRGSWPKQNELALRRLLVRLLVNS